MARPAQTPLPAPLGLIAALEPEAAGLIHQIGQGPEARLVHAASRVIHVGHLWGQPCVLVLAGVGKVAAATTATLLIERFRVGAILFTGVAGGIGAGVQIGDVVVASHMVHHDLDARPIFPRYEIPLLGLSHLPADPDLTRRLLDAATAHVAGSQAGVHHGLVASGDQFIHEPGAAQALARDLPGLLAVEMEGAAVAQVCRDFAVPCAVVRTISDRADAAAATDFPIFLHETASRHSTGIVRRFLSGE